MADQRHETELSRLISNQTYELLGGSIMLSLQVQEVDVEVSVIPWQGARSEKVHLQITTEHNCDPWLVVRASELLRRQNESTDDQRVFKPGRDKQ